MKKSKKVGASDEEALRSVEMKAEWAERDEDDDDEE